jgi:hypothetical protein
MHPRIGFVEILVGHEGPRRLVGDAPGQVAVLAGMIGGQLGGSQDHLGAVGLEQVHLVGRNAIGHGDHEAVALEARRDGQAYPRVPEGGFHQGGAGLEPALRFGRLDHGQAGAVLHAAAGIEPFQLGQDVGAARARQAAQAHQGRLADQFEDVVGDAVAARELGKGGHGRRMAFRAALSSRPPARRPRPCGPCRPASGPRPWRPGSAGPGSTAARRPRRPARNCIRCRGFPPGAAGWW